jgi:peptidase E
MASGTIYVGSSAGAIMAGRTCQMAFWKDWDDRSCEGTVNVDWTKPDVAKGLNLAGGRSIFPHANGQYADPEWQRAQARKHGHTDHEVVALADGQGLLIEDDEVRRIG